MFETKRNRASSKRWLSTCVGMTKSGPCLRRRKQTNILVSPTADADVASATLVVGARIPLVLAANRIIVCKELVPDLFASVHQRVEVLAAGTSKTFVLPLFLIVVFHSVFAPEEVLLLWCVRQSQRLGRVGHLAFCHLLSVVETEIFPVLLSGNRCIWT